MQWILAIFRANAVIYMCGAYVCACVRGSHVHMSSTLSHSRAAFCLGADGPRGVCSLLRYSIISPCLQIFHFSRGLSETTSLGISKLRDPLSETQGDEVGPIAMLSALWTGCHKSELHWKPKWFSSKIHIKNALSNSRCWKCMSVSHLSMKNATFMQSLIPTLCRKQFS